jgi:AcrR family transcriptional regulator
VSAGASSTLFNAAVRAIARHGITQVQLRDIAAEADLPLLAVYDHIPGRGGLARFLSEEIDRAMVAEAEQSDAEASVRDRLFELLMLRFDRLMPLRGALAKIGQPAGAAGNAAVLIDLPGLLISIRRSMALALELVGVSTAGIGGQVRIQGLTLVYIASLRSWLGDDSPDMGATMKTLDQQLARAERWAPRIR